MIADTCADLLKILRLQPPQIQAGGQRGALHLNGAGSTPDLSNEQITLHNVLHRQLLTVEDPVQRHACDVDLQRVGVGLTALYAVGVILSSAARRTLGDQLNRRRLRPSSADLVHQPGAQQDTGTQQSAQGLLPVGQTDGIVQSELHGDGLGLPEPLLKGGPQALLLSVLKRLQDHIRDPLLYQILLFLRLDPSGLIGDQRGHIALPVEQLGSCS